MSHTRCVVAADRVSDSAFSGCYDARRASALSGVPISTVYWWANHDVVVPSVSPVQEKLWSWADLMALRIVSWLRRPKRDEDGIDSRSASPMPKVRLALSRLSQLEVDLVVDPSPLLVDRVGEIFIRVGGKTTSLSGEDVIPELETFQLLAPFSIGDATGPDLVRPREHLRIIPSRVVGEPHLEHTRITSRTLFALERRGFESGQIADMYEVPVLLVHEAIDLEEQLASAAA